MDALPGSKSKSWCARMVKYADNRKTDAIMGLLTQVADALESVRFKTKDGRKMTESEKQDWATTRKALSQEDDDEDEDECDGDEEEEGDDDGEDKPSKKRARTEQGSECTMDLAADEEDLTVCG